MRGVAPEGIGLATIFAVSLLGYWDLDSVSGGWVFRLLLAVFCVTALASGRRNGWAEAVVGGLLVGFLAPVMFYSGVVLAELGSGEFGEAEPPLLVFFVTVYSIVFGVPFAIAGAFLAALSHPIWARRQALKHA